MVFRCVYTRFLKEKICMHVLFGIPDGFQQHCLSWGWCQVGLCSISGRGFCRCFEYWLHQVPARSMVCSEGGFFFPKKKAAWDGEPKKNRLERDQKVSSGIHLHRGVVCQVSLCPKHPWTCALCHDTMVSLQTPLRFDGGGFGSGGIQGNPGIGFGIWRGFLEEMLLSWIQLLKLFEDLFSKKRCNYIKWHQTKTIVI